MKASLTEPLQQQSAERCVSTLLDLIQTKVNYVVQEAIVVIKGVLGLPPVLPMMAGTDLSAWSGGGVVIVINKADICTVIWGWRADE